MTVKAIEKSSATEMEYIGLSTDAKPTAPPYGATFYEYDTKAIYIYTPANTWVVM